MNSESTAQEMLNNFLLPLAYDVNRALQRYLAVHDMVFSQPLLAVVDYRAVCADLQSLLASLASAEEDLHSDEEHYMATGGQVAEIAGCLDDYIAALSHTVHRLHALGVRLHEKTTGERPRWREYRRMYKAYEATIPAYTKAGSRLTAAIRSVAPSFFAEDDASR